MNNLLEESQHQRLAEAIGGRVISRRAITTPDGHVVDVSVAGVVRADGRAIGRICDGVDRLATAYRVAVPDGSSIIPAYVYVASSWRNPMQQAVVHTLGAAGIDCYDFRNPAGGTGFSWREVKSDYAGPRIGADGIRAKGSDWEPVDEYLRMVAHPRAVEGYAADFAAMEKADTFVMVLPCGKSAHLELGWAIGAGKRTAILLEDPVEPELMYRGADFLAPNLHALLGWLGVKDS